MDDSDDLTAAVDTLLDVATRYAEAQMKGRPVEPQGTHGNVIHRTILSAIVQQAASRAAARGMNGFNVFDGIAHGVAAIAAQGDAEMLAATARLFERAIPTYGARTQAAIKLAAADPKGRA